MSEFGGEDGGTDTARVAGLADSTPVNHQPLSWTYWAALQNHDPTGGSMERLYTARRQLVQPKGCILARAYAPAVAGDPSAQSFDPVSGVFKLTYTPDPAIKAPTEIFVPPIHSGGSYRVQVTGATPTSPPSSTNLTLSNNPGATSVSVEVDPTGSSQCPALVAAALPPVAGLAPGSRAAT